MNPSRDATIDVRVFSLDCPTDEVTRLLGLLDETERSRADRYVREADRSRFIAAHGRLRQILAAYVSDVPRALSFVHGPHGKPFLGNAPGIHFSLSHSDGLAGVAVSRRFPVGFDIERVRPVPAGVAARYFSMREQAELSLLPEAVRESGFYECWTRKEAVIKALGDGMTRRLDSFDVPLGNREPAPLRRLDGDPLDGASWRVAGLDIEPGYAGAVACDSGGTPVNLGLVRGWVQPLA